MSGKDPKRPGLRPSSIAPPAPTAAGAAPPAAQALPAVTTEDERWMDVALTLAKNGSPSPNPHVGAVVVKDGEIIASAHHERAGTDHAEVAALRGAGDKAKGASLYV